MSERITFHFEGGLASEHTLNFYEAARFQYAAARLMVKLSQFRQRGSFVRNITSSTNFNILLLPSTEGSFNINTDSSDEDSREEKFIDASLGDMFSFVSERLVEKGDEDSLRSSLVANRDVLSGAGLDAANDRTDPDELIRYLEANPNLREMLHPETREAIERRIAEVERTKRLKSVRSELAKIDAAREQKLISMSAPLFSEMATALRRSATSLEVISKRSGGDSRVLYLNERMASEIETAKVDEQITPILADIIQYNKETGYGKVRLANIARTIGFSIPSDTKDEMQADLISQMGKDMVFLQAYFVRDRAKEVVRLIVVGLLPLPE